MVSCQWRKLAWPLAMLTLTLALEVECAPDKSQSSSSNQATARLMKDLADVYKSDSYKMGVFEVDLAGDNIYEWNVMLNIVDEKLALHQDLMRLKAEGKGEAHIMLRVSYGQDYPVAPPFVRIVYPTLKGVWILRGGAICMDLIAKSGWNSGYTSEALILAIAQHLIDGQTRVESAPGSSEPDQTYTDKNARDRFREIVVGHNWDGEQRQEEKRNSPLVRWLLFGA